MQTPHRTTGLGRSHRGPEKSHGQPDTPGETEVLRYLASDNPLLSRVHLVTMTCFHFFPTFFHSGSTSQPVCVTRRYQEFCAHRAMSGVVQRGTVFPGVLHSVACAPTRPVIFTSNVFIGQSRLCRSCSLEARPLGDAALSTWGGGQQGNQPRGRLSALQTSH